VFSLVGFAAIAIFGVVNLTVEHQSLVGDIEIGSGVLTLANVLYLRQAKRPAVSASILLGLFFTVLLVLFLSGGVQRTGIYWFSLFPILAFFLKGKHRGMLWILALMAAVLLLQLASQVTTVSLAYDPIEIRQLLASLSILSIFIYLYFEYIREHDQHVLVEREQQLYERNRELREQITAQHEAEIRQRELISTIDKTITQMQQKNADLENTKLAMINILEDLEKEKRLTLENERKDEALLESIGEGVIATDTDDEIILANNQAGELLGYDSTKIIGGRFTKVVQPVDGDGKLVPLKNRPIRLAMSSGKPISTNDYSYTRKDGTSFPVAITASPIELEGKQIGGIVVFRDITREKQIDQAKTEFVSLASHQLRTPLSAIGWYVEMLLSGDAGKLDATQTEYLKEIQHGGKRLVDMVNSLLNVSRIELGTFMVEPKPTKPVEIAEAVLGEVKALITKKQLTLKRHFAKDIPVITLDPHLLQIILQNLVSNSIKYTPDKGTITLSLGVKDDAFAIKIQDTGIGIPKEQHGRIFEKLFRADNVKKTDTDGTGLGLYMVKQILDEIGGTIQFTSAAGKGTTFLVFMPLKGMKKRAGSRRLS